MAQAIKQSDLPLYAGKFSFVSSELQRSIKATKPDYDKTDPKTWPLVTSQCVEEHLGYQYDGVNLLPPFVAYERELVEQCTRLWSDQSIEVYRDNNGKVRCRRYFHYFPFLFHPEGRATGFDHLSDYHYKRWVFNVTGKLPQIRAEVTAADPTSQGLYDQILQMIREPQSEPTTEEIERLQQELAAQKQRADNAEAIIHDDKEIFDAELADEKRRTKTTDEQLQLTKKALEAYKSQHVNTRKIHELTVVSLQNAEALSLARLNELQVLTDKLTSETAGKLKVKADLLAHAKDLEAAKSEAATAKDQFISILDVLKEAKEARGRKRAADDEEVALPAKRVKIELED